MVGKCFTTQLSQHLQLSFSFSIDGTKHMTKATHKMKSILGAPAQSSRELKSMTIMVGSVATGRRSGELMSAPQSQGREMVWASEPSKPSDTTFYKGTLILPSQPAPPTLNHTLKHEPLGAVLIQTSHPPFLFQTLALVSLKL